MKLALWQGDPVADWTAARAALPGIIAQARGADLLVLPEMYLTGYAIGAGAVTAVAAEAGAMLAHMQALARGARLAIAFGHPEPGPDGVWNAATLVDATGSVVATCRKTHLYGAVDRDQFVPGDAIGAVADLNGWRVALAICYDVEFPELIRAQALAGADLIVVPTANMMPFTGVPLRVVPTRAEENEVFVAYANYTGSEAEHLYCGLSCVAGPDGRDVARAGTGVQMLHATLDRGAIAAARQTVGHIADRRTDLY